MELYGRTARVGMYATDTSSCNSIYLCVLCYCEACLKSSALLLGVKTLHNTQCQLVVKCQLWYCLLPRCNFGHFGSYYFCVNRHYLVQYLITDLKQNKHDHKKKSRQILSNQNVN